MQTSKYLLAVGVLAAVILPLQVQGGPDSEEQANRHLADRTFLSDLYVLQNGGRSLWNGKSEMRLRGALPDEAALWAAGGNAADQQGSSPSRVFLIPVVDPLKHDNDDDDIGDQDQGD